MKLLFVADLHYALKQFDWVAANASGFGAVIIGGDLLDLASFLDLDVQIVVIEKYLNRLRSHTQLIVSSGNHDTDRRNESGEAIAHWLREVEGPSALRGRRRGGVRRNADHGVPVVGRTGHPRRGGSNSSPPTPCGLRTNGSGSTTRRRTSLR